MQAEKYKEKMFLK